MRIRRERILADQLVDRNALAIFRAEQARGIRHTDAYVQKMKIEEAFADEEIGRASCRERV